MPHRQREVSLKSLLIVEMMFLVGFATACTTTSSASNPNPGSNASTSTVSTPRPTSTPTPSPTPTVDRHGLPANVPLPNNVVFKSQGTMVRFSTGPISTPTFSASCISTSVDKTWVWTVPSSNTAAMVQHFYQQNLMNGAWSFTHVRKVCQGEGNYLFVSSCEKAGMKQILFVAIGSKLSVENSQGQTTSSITASAGESLLAIALAPAGQDQTVLGSTIPGNTSLFCN